MRRAAVIGLWVLVVAVAAAAVVKNMGGAGGGHLRAARSASNGPQPATTSTSTLGPDPTQAPPATIHSENDVLDRLDGVAPPGPTRWDDFQVFNQAPGVDVAVAQAIDGSGAMAFYAFGSADDAQAFADDPALHLVGIGDYNAFGALSSPAGAPPGAHVADLRTCGRSATPSTTSNETASCPGGAPTHSSGAIVVVPLDSYALVTTAWNTTPGQATAGTEGRAMAEAGEALAFWAQTPK